MCFKVQKGNIFPKRAKEDIVCYKYVCKKIDVDDTYHSMFQNFKYKKNKMYTCFVFPFIKLFSNKIFKGFHSYQINRNCNVECVIPKGSYYWSNDKEYCSNRIIIKNEITFSYP